MYSNLSFQRLYAEADDKYGIAKLIVPHQQESSAIEKAISQNKKDEKDNPNSISNNHLYMNYSLQHPDVNKLRALVYHVKYHPTSQANVIKRYKRDRYDDSYDIYISQDSVLDSWEDEVRNMMNDDYQDHRVKELADEHDHVDITQPTTSVHHKPADNNSSNPKNRVGDDIIPHQMKEVSIPDEYFVPNARLPHVIAPYFCFDSNIIDADYDEDDLDVLIPNVKLGGDVIEEKLSSGMTEDIKPSYNNVSSIQPPLSTSSSQAETTQEKHIKTSITGNKELTTLERKRLLAEKKKSRLMNVNLGSESVKSLDKIFGSKRSRDDFSSSSRKHNRSVISSLNHAPIASSHRNTKPDLREVDLRYFHHPHLPVNTSFTIIVKPEGKDKKSSSSTSSGSNRMIASTQAERNNTSLLDGDIVLMEYIEERPPIIQNIGMASAITNYEQSSGVEADPDIDPTSSTTSSSSSKSKMWSLIDTYRLPRHLILLLKQRDNKSLNAEIDNSFAPKSAFGERMMIGNDEESPFLGKLDPGTSQHAIVNNLFKAPLFKQDSTLSNDFLIISLNERNTVKYVLRPICKVFTVGQIEPQKVVPRPVQRITDIQEKFYLLAAARCFAMDVSLGGLEYARIQNVILKYCAKETRSPHKHHHREKLKLIISKVASEARDGSIMKWYPKDFYEAADIHYEGYNGSELERMYSEEELAKTFTPEDVCLQESCNAMEYFLLELGIPKDIDLPMIDDWLQRMHRMISLKEDQYIQFKRQKQSYLSYDKDNNIIIVQSLNRLMKIQMSILKKLYDSLRVGEFIFERLVNAPWNTTEAYYSCILDKDNKNEVMEITSEDCDPSGCGEGFSYRHIVKLPTNRNMTKAQQEKLSGTDKDLRKLTNPQLKAILTKLGVDNKELSQLGRWDMVHLVRDLMNQTSMKGLIPNVLQKFVRIEGVFGSALNDSIFKQRCQEIWLRQKESLSWHHDASSYDILSSSHDMMPVADDVDDLERSIERSLRLREDEMIKLATDELKSSSSSKPSTSSSHDNKHAEKEYQNLEEVLQNLSSSTAIAKPSINKSIARIVHDNGDQKDKQDPSQPSDDDISAPSVLPIIINPPSYQQRPLKVVKRVTKIYHDDGNKVTESIKVEFVISELECRRVEEETMRERKLRELRKHHHPSLSSSRRGRHMSFDDDIVDEEQIFTTSSGTLGINFGALKRKVSEAAAMDERYGDDAYLRQQYRTTKRGNVSITKKSRLPRVDLAARFEKEIFDLWDMKKAHIFRFPVPREVAKYYDIITNPICLMDIRDKIADYRYASAKEFLDDVILMAENAEIYNGKASDIAKNGWKLVNKLKRGLNHDREHFGTEGDTIRILEEAIQKKEFYGKKARVINRTSGTSSSSVSLSAAAPIKPLVASMPVAPTLISPHAASNPIPSTQPYPIITTSSDNTNLRATAQEPAQTEPPMLITEQAKALSAAPATASTLPQPPAPSLVPSITSKMMSMLDDDSSGDEEILEEG